MSGPSQAGRRAAVLFFYSPNREGEQHSAPTATPDPNGCSMPLLTNRTPDRAS